MTITINKNDPDFSRQIKLAIKKSQRLLKTGRLSLNDGDYGSAASRAYYSIFHLMEAALLFKNLTFSKHSAVIANFNLHFMKTRIFPKEFSKTIERLFEQRQLGDYDVEASISDEDAKENLALAAKTAGLIIKFLQTGLIGNSKK